MKKRPGTRITPKLTITVGGSVTPVKTTTTVPPSTTGLSSVPLVSFEVVERAGVITIQHFDQNVLNEKVRRMISFYLKLAQQEKNVHYIVLMAHPLLEVFSVGVDLGELRDNLILMTPSANTIVHTNYSSVGTVEPPCVNTSFTPSASTSLRRSSLTGESGTLSDKVAEGRSPTMEGVKESGTLLSNSSLPAGVPSLTANTFSLNDLCSEIELSRKYVLVALHGAVVGGGLEVALSAHSRLATYDSYFGFPEVKFGFSPSGGGTQRLPRLVGVRRACQLLLSGNLIDVEDAVKWGLVDAVVDVERAERVRNRLLLSAAVAYGKSVIQQGKLRLYTRQSRDKRQQRTFGDAKRISNMVYNFIFFKIADYYLRHTLPQGWTCPYFVLDAVKAATVYNSAPQFLKGIAAEYECLVAATNTPSAGALTYYLKNLSICRNTVPRRFKTEYQKKKRGLSNPSSRSSSAQVATPPRSPAASGFAPPAGSTSIRRVAILGCTPKALRHAAQYMYHNIPVLIIPCSLRHMGMREASFWAGQPCSPGSPMSAQSPTHISTDDVDISENTQGVLRYLEGFLAEMVMSRAGKTQCRSAQSDRNIEKYCNRDVAEALRERENYNDSFEDTTRGLRLDISEESIPQRKRPFTVEEVFRVQNALKLCRIMSVEDDQLLLVQDVDLIVCYRGSFVSRQESVKQSLSHYFNENDELAYSGVLRFLFTRLDGRAKNNCTFLFDNYENLCLARKQLSEFRHDRLFMMFSYLSQLSPTPAEERVTLLEVGAVGHSFSVAAMEALQCLFRRMGNLIVLFTRALPQVKSCPCDHSPKGKVGSKDNLSLPKEAPLADSQRDLKQESSLSERRDVEAPQLDASTFVVHCEEDKSSVMEHYSFSGLRLFATGFFQLLLLLEKSIHTIDTIEKSLLSFGFKQGPFLTCQILGVQNVWYEICLQHFDPTVAYLNDAHEDDKCKCPLVYVSTLPVVSELIQWMLVEEEYWYTQTVEEVQLKEVKPTSRHGSLNTQAEKETTETGEETDEKQIGKKKSKPNGSSDDTASDIEIDTSSSSAASPRPLSQKVSFLNPEKKNTETNLSSRRTMRQVKNRINPKVVRKLAELVKKAHRTAQADRPFSLYDDYPGRRAIDEVDIQRLLLCPWVQESVHLFEGANEEGEPRSLSLLSEDEHSVTGRFFNVARSSDLDIFSVTVLGFPRWRGGIHYDSVYNGESSLFIVNRLLWGVQQREERAFAAAASQHSFLDVIKGFWSSWIHDNSHDDRPSFRFQPYHKVWTSYPSVLLNEIAADLTQYTALAEEESGEEVVKLLKVCGGEESRPKASPSKRLRVSFNTTKLDVWE